MQVSTMDHMMIKGQLFIVMALSALVSMLVSIQVISVDMALYAISPAAFEQAIYLNANSEWTFNREHLASLIFDQLDYQLAMLTYPTTVDISFYDSSGANVCDEYVVPCNAVSLKIAVDYHLFIQTKVVSYELYHE